jgi:FMN phosphatase YigB (HAD superfamily)
VSRTQDARDALRRCRAAGLDVYVFSNAPAVWCEATLGAMGFLDRLVPRAHVVSSDHPALQGTSKPLSAAYKGFAEVAGVGSHGGRAATFVDDTVGNLLPLLHAPAWTPVLYSPSQPGGGAMPQLPQRVLQERTRLRLVRSLGEAVDGVLAAL